jgi:hypothetical protein
LGVVCRFDYEISEIIFVEIKIRTTESWNEILGRNGEEARL